MDIQSLKYRALQGQYLKANNYIASLEKALAAANAEADGLRELRKSDLAHIGELESENALLRKDRGEKEEKIADLEARLEEANTTIGRLSRKEEEDSKKLEEAKKTEEILALSKEAGVDLKNIVTLLQLRMFSKNSDRTRFLNGEFDFDERRVEELGFNGMMGELDSLMRRLSKEAADNGEAEEVDKPNLPKDKRKSPKKRRPGCRRNVFSIAILKRYGIDASNLPKGSKIIHRKNEKGEDVWVIRLYGMKHAEAYAEEYEIARFNVPGSDPQSSRYPDTILPGNPLMPSFARFYLDMKIHYNLSENHILEMLHDMKAMFPQSSLNKWMHQIMSCLRYRLLDLMLKVLKESRYTNNDETRILVRNLADENAPTKYKIEYIHAALSAEKKLLVMLYGEGSRSHEIQEEQVFAGSGIRIFTADRAKLYETIVNGLEKHYGIKVTRTACWFHARHYFCDAFVSDHRMKPVIELMNYLFYIERYAKSHDYTFAQRLNLRLKYSRKVVTAIMNILERMKNDKNANYGRLVMRAINYVLDDRQAFQVFLTDGMVEIHNIAIERCFRHIANGRRNWQQAG
ncbi:MAG: transposase, partial [Candidatus Cryptobacteroides sp.]